MKVLPFSIPKPGFARLIYQEDHEPVFYNKLHQHKEIQISYLVKGSGTLIVADALKTYKTGDIFVIGGDVPHVFKSDEPRGEPSYMKSLFFDRESFGAGFFDLEETSELKLFFERSRLGMQVVGDQQPIRDIFDALAEASKLSRFIALLQILKLLTQVEVVPLSASDLSLQLSSKDGQRLREVFEYTMQYYQNDIRLERIAEVANMTKTAFCKYFKKRTNKTYNQFLNEYRVEMVNKALQADSEESIAQLAYEHGFGSISNFNKTFKRLKGIPPSAV